MDKKKVIKYIVITYAIAWTLQIIGSLYAVNNPGLTGTLVFQGALAVCMYAPALAAFLVKADFKGMGWKPKFKGNIGWLFFAAYVALPLTAIGAAIFFLIFPGLFDTSGSYMIAQYEAQGLDIETKLKGAGLDMQTLLIMSFIPALYAPFFNIITAIGEEVGWRGFLYPELNKGLGRVKTWIIGGAVWAAFHFPAMIFGGYEYGFDYLGSPWLGLIAFTVCCIVLGTLEEIVYSKTKCIWYAALFHGSFNAMATFPQLVMNANNEDLGKYIILGPLPNGLIAMIPMAVLAIIMGIAVIKTGSKKEVSV